MIDNVIPCRETINKFEQLMLPVFKEIKNNGLQSRTLVELRDTLLPKLLSGELSVDKVQKLIEAPVES